MDTTPPNYLVDFIHDSEGTGSDSLESHEVQHGGHTPLTPTLSLGIQRLELLRVPELDWYLHRVVTKVLLHMSKQGECVKYVTTC